MSFKSLVVVFCLMIGSQSFANVEVLESPIKGKAMRGLGGIIQIFNPYVTTPHNDQNLFLKADDMTAEVSCKMLEKRFHSYKMTQSTASYYLSFDGEGIMNVETDGYYKKDAVISVLICY